MTPGQIVDPSSSSKRIGNPCHGKEALRTRSGRRVRVLLTEGSSLSARQTLYALGRVGAVIDVCDPRPLFCLGRYSRYTHACFRCPSFTVDPPGYLQFLCDRLRTGGYDVLFPVHDQVYLLAQCRSSLGTRVGVPVPHFAAVERLQSKAEFVRLLAEVGLPHPETRLVRTRAELERVTTFPCYIKLAHSTAGRGVWLLADAAARDRLIAHLEKTGLLSGDFEILVQQPAAGVLRVVQCVFQHGRLVAGHCYQATALGVGGSARARVSVSHPRVLEQVAALGGFLNWHGAMTLDYLWDGEVDQHAYIDANPRIGETFNATLSGVNLCAALIRVALDEQVALMKRGREGIRTHSALMTLLAGAQRGDSRRALVRELCSSWIGEGLYAGSADELTRPGEDFPSIIPALWAAGRVLLRPRAANRLIGSTVENYALDGCAARKIKQLNPGSPLP